MELEYYHARVYWGSKQRGDEIFDWIKDHCPSYINCFGKPIDPSKPSRLENYNLDLYFGDAFEAMLCQLKWS